MQVMGAAYFLEGETFIILIDILVLLLLFSVSVLSRSLI